jgi:hypothetical protein
MAETDIAKIVPIVSLGILLTAAALAWSCESRTADIAVVDPGLLPPSDTMLMVNKRTTEPRVRHAVGGGL